MLVFVLVLVDGVGVINSVINSVRVGVGLITGDQSKQDQMLIVKIGEYLVFLCVP